jgi:hypothetical protein
MTEQDEGVAGESSTFRGATHRRAVGATGGSRATISRALANSLSRCRNTQLLGSLGAEILALGAAPVQKYAGLGPPGCICAAVFAPF